MKLLSYTRGGAPLLGVLTAGGANVLDAKELGLSFADMNDLVTRVTDEELDVLRAAAAGADGLPLSDVTLLAPIPTPRQDVICLGVNYLEHARETSRFTKEDWDSHRDYPVYFSKRVNEAVATGAPIQSHADLVDDLDYEVELAAILRRDARSVKADDAGSCIFGYTILNDVSARAIQNRHKQWYRGKSMDGFTPMGPWIVTADEFSFPPQVRLRCLVNGEVRQDSSTANMIFDLSYIIEELSAGMTLKAGTVISTGTPSGVGMGFHPPRYLRHGDVVTCEIEGIGMLENQVD